MSKSPIPQLQSSTSSLLSEITDIDLKDVAEFENKIVEKCKSVRPEIIEAIQSLGKLDDDKEKLLVEVITQLKGTFKS